LWSTPILDKNGKLGEFGIYQHFNYYDSKPVIDGSDQTPYRISEPAALGPGFISFGNVAVSPFQVPTTIEIRTIGNTQTKNPRRSRRRQDLPITFKGNSYH
jgi:hypothetical protein